MIEVLSRIELKWRLMEANQIQNRAKLEEFRAEASQDKKKMIKTIALANKLRAKYVKAAKAAKLAQSAYKRAEAQLLSQEKFVADEKMQLTKLAVECHKIGSLLYGPEYRLAINSANDSISKKIKSASSKQSTAALMQNLAPFLRKKCSIHLGSTDVIANYSSVCHIKKCKQSPPPTRLSSLYNLKDSRLRSLTSYRLTTKFTDLGIPITDLRYTHNISPNEYICYPDLVGNCTDKSCLYQHKSNYLMTDIEKLADILSYKPSLTGFKPDPCLSERENDNKCRIKLKQYAAKLLAKNSDKSVETIAQNLVNYVRANKSDVELLTMTRSLPKASHSSCNIPSEVKAIVPTMVEPTTITKGSESVDSCQVVLPESIEV